jgi:hypothetical protein
MISICNSEKAHSLHTVSLCTYFIGAYVWKTAGDIGGSHYNDYEVYGLVKCTAM